MSTVLNLIVECRRDMCKVLGTMQIFLQKHVLLGVGPVVALRQCFLVDGFRVIQKTVVVNEAQFLLTIVE